MQIDVVDKINKNKKNLIIAYKTSVKKHRQNRQQNKLQLDHFINRQILKFKIIKIVVQYQAVGEVGKQYDKVKRIKVEELEINIETVKVVEG